MASMQERLENGTLTFTWRATMRKNTCPDCEERHGAGGLNLDEWQGAGLPGTGHTVCLGSCHCHLIPDNLVEVDAEVMEPFNIKDALDAFPLVTDPVEAARIAANVRLMGEFQSGRRARYEGPIRQLRGEIGTIRAGGSAENGVILDFDIDTLPATHRFPEFASIQVYDLSDLIPVGE